MSVPRVDSLTAGPTHYSLILVAHGPPLVAHATFPAEHLSFQGHFPNNPILPAFMQVQLALDTLNAAQLPHKLLSSAAAKFLRPIAPGSVITVTLTPIEGAVVAELTVGDTLCSTFTLIVQ